MAIQFLLALTDFITRDLCMLLVHGSGKIIYNPTSWLNELVVCAFKKVLPTVVES